MIDVACNVKVGGKRAQKNAIKRSTRAFKGIKNPKPMKPKYSSRSPI